MSVSLAAAPPPSDPLPADFLPSEPSLRQTEAQLMRCVAAGDQSAFAVVMRRHASRLAARMRAMVGPADAEDLAQETWLRAWCAAARFDAAKGSIGAWLDRIARNLAIDHLRRAAPASLPLDPALPGDTPDALTWLAAREQAEHLRRFLHALPAGQRLALLGRSNAGGRAREGRLYRARNALRALMAEA